MDDLDDVVNIEEMVQASSKEEGRKAGLLVGYAESYALGATHGGRLGEELGAIAGACHMLLLSTEELRIKEQLQAVLAMISAIPTANSMEGNPQEELLKVRSLFRKACNLLKMPTLPTELLEPSAKKAMAVSF